MPTFGNTNIEASSLSIENTMVAGVFTMGGVAGEADSITFYYDISVALTGTLKITCGIYDMSGNLITNGQTEERTWDTAVSPPSDGWLTFNFTGTKPALAASTQYRLVAWANSIAGSHQSRVVASGGSGVHIVSETYDGVMDASESWTTLYASGKASIYCTYTEVAAAIRQLASAGVGV